MAQIGTKWFKTVKFFVRGFASKGPPLLLVELWYFGPIFGYFVFESKVLSLLGKTFSLLTYST